MFQDGYMKRVSMRAKMYALYVRFKTTPQPFAWQSAGCVCRAAAGYSQTQIHPIIVIGLDAIKPLISRERCKTESEHSSTNKSFRPR